jgi:hypothetical protein
MKKMLLLVILMSFVTLSACTYTGAVRTGIAPISTVAKTYRGNASLLIDPAINTAEITTGVGAHTVKVSAGNALNSAIVEAVRSVMPNATTEASPQSISMSGIVIKARLQHISANAPIDQGFWSSRTNITAQVSVVIEMLRPDGSLLYRQVVTGTGLESRSVGSVDKVREGVEFALERAIQQVSDGTASVLVTGINQLNNDR